MADSGITESSLKNALTERLKATHVEVTDMSGGCGQSFTSLIVSPQFAGLNSLKRHRAVNAALKDEIAAIHAWSAKCQTPEEWERDNAKNSGVSKPPMNGTVRGKVEGTDA
ncbi:bola domain-containing protein [Pseudomassariella vexata]|uniref:Bola domain-containing protein n=1 Tax=Pseudomassariella vexata TaxID=1141098 RepID=A0A1Y2DHY4_9PEZI|nr:bola domain-containing protein [Pseudomassariella vexata]ORY58853.1 bola domain-containing protein [Pseudomassariella vexata]